ncbi:CoA-binding protein [Chloroflexales bacterium ZM16-3]|nr:CoA-binding protein [Chloroflexales bacterium ZM16-3]
MAYSPTQPVTLAEKVADFLAQPRIAVAGVSATRQLSGTLIYRKLKETGHQVVAILPGAETFEGDPCYPELAAIPGGVGGVVIVTRPTVTLELVRQAVAAGVPRVWMHESMMRTGTSVSPEAVALCKEHGVTLIAGACPMMYCAPVDFGHRCMRWMMGATGGLPT